MSNLMTKEVRVPLFTFHFCVGKYVLESTARSKFDSTRGTTVMYTFWGECIHSGSSACFFWCVEEKKRLEKVRCLGWFLVLQRVLVVLLNYVKHHNRSRSLACAMGSEPFCTHVKMSCSLPCIMVKAGLNHIEQYRTDVTLNHTFRSLHCAGSSRFDWV